MTKNNRAKQLRREHAEKNNLTYAEAPRNAHNDDRSAELSMMLPDGISGHAKALIPIYATIDAVRAFLRSENDEQHVVKTYDNGVKLAIHNYTSTSDDARFEVWPNLIFPDGTAFEFTDEGTVFKTNGGGTLQYITDGLSDDHEYLLTEVVCNDLNLYCDVLATCNGLVSYELDGNGSYVVTIILEDPLFEFDDAGYDQVKITSMITL